MSLNEESLCLSYEQPSTRTVYGFLQAYYRKIKMNQEVTMVFLGRAKHSLLCLDAECI